MRAGFGDGAGGRGLCRINWHKSYRRKSSRTRQHRLTKLPELQVQASQPLTDKLG